MKTNNPISHQIHVITSNQKMRRIALGMAIVLCLAIVLLRAIPAAHHAKAEIATIEQQIAQTQETIEKLKKEQQAQEVKFREMRDAPARAMQAALNAGGFSEDDIAYWRKQMSAFGQMNRINIVILKRGTSKYANATELTVDITPMSTTPLTTYQIATALDFLQLYGFIESFDGKTAVIHVGHTN